MQRWLRRNEVLAHVLGALLVTAFLTFALARLTFWPSAAAGWLVYWLTAVNGVVVAYYAWDKRQAIRGGRRVPELALHTLAVAGGSPGAFLAMKWFRHKTIKGRFRIVFWLIVAIQAVLVALVLRQSWFVSPG
jgi:uncharacterized membrane protein YsdA (DUF1294 family)